MNSIMKKRTTEVNRPDFMGGSDALQDYIR